MLGWDSCTIWQRGGMQFDSRAQWALGLGDKCRYWAYRHFHHHRLMKHLQPIIKSK